MYNLPLLKDSGFVVLKDVNNFKQINLLGKKLLVNFVLYNK